ncbi:DegT/DnrJ/EryC1/StrS family aminotransferase [Streptomyces cupreus]|uniref:DegT/DnrJ/EryC1/StrS family aminotransferase n=1 Tax=Streptomyces cupreus TaxID=2759956 RepID=A0A7X1J1J7_9ACTN|nr:DegT/DnrJ/EryC1/StrS family aminotransferase [Streptomyces cupreus]MBC2902399.1 DegT/DnrJ/EryC1/StrS family aminotransferase [Streptomyces cupreus]
MTATNASALAMQGGKMTVRPAALSPWPEITDADRRAVNAVLDRGDIWAIHGREATALEDEWAEYCGVAHCHAVNTGTAALRCAVVAAGIQEGDEVILPAFGYIASAQAVMLARGVPVFCDNDPRTYNLDIGAVESVITSRTRALMPVYLHGLVTDTSAITELAARRNLAVIPDAAQAAGATENGRRAGGFGTCTAFSLNGQKPFQSAEGGLITTDDPEVFTAVSRFAALGEDRPRHLKPGETRASWAGYVGEQYRLTEITATLARSQLRRLDSYLATARQNAADLAAGLADIPGFDPPYVPEECESSHYRWRLRLDPAAYGWEGSLTEFRDRVLYGLQKEGVAADTWQLHPLPAHPVIRRRDRRPWAPSMDASPLEVWNPGRYPVASRLLASSITLGADPYPLHVQRREVIADYVRAFHKLAENMKTVMTAPYEPVRPAPSIPVSDL